MIIGIDARLWSETGVGRYIRQIFYLLPKIDKKNDYVWFLSEKEFQTLNLPRPNWKKVLAKLHWHTLSEQIMMPILFYREKLDLLHIPYVNFPFLYFGKTVSTIHDLIPDHFKTGRASTLPFWFYLIKKIGYHFLVWMATVRARRIFTLSRDAQHELVAHYHLKPEKIVFTYEAGTLEGNMVKTTSQIQQYKPYILYVGNAHPHKNVENLIKAMDYLPELNLVLAGYDNFFFPKLPKHPRVIPIGFIPNEEIIGWYKNASAFVSASRMEGFGIPPLEAMSVGCPVILSDIPVFHEINGEAAIYFNEEDPKNIAEVISKTLKNKKLLENLVKKGYKQVQNYSWEKMVSEIHRTYEEVI